MSNNLEIKNPNNNSKSVNLDYNYARINTSTGLCTSVATTSYEINNPAFILVPTATMDYKGKYYHDGHWYADSQFSIPCPELDW